MTETNIQLTIGDAIYLAIKPIIKIYLVIFIGWLSVKYDMISMETSRGLSNSLVNLILPCLSFNNIVANLSGSKIKEIGVVVLTALMIFGSGGLLSYLLSFITPVPKKWFWGSIFAGIFANISDIPIAYIQSMSGGLIFSQEQADQAVTMSCVFLACQQFLMMNCGMFQLVGLDFKESLNDEENSLDQPKSDKNSSNCSNYNSTDGKVENLVNNNNNNEDDDDELHLTFTETTHSLHRINTLKNKNHSFQSLNRRKSIESSRSFERPNEQNLESMVNEYSEADVLKNQKNMEELAKTLSLSQEIGLNLERENEKRSKWNKFIQTHNLGWFEFVLVNFKRPPSAVLILSMIIAMIPWLRGLFVKNNEINAKASDGDPVLSVFMDFTSYVGAAAVPIGLILLGGTIARLKVDKIEPGFIWSALSLTLMRLVLMPIIGVLFVNRIYNVGMIETDTARFLLILSFSVPSATAQIYFTAFYTPLEGDHVQMGCLAIIFMLQYPILIISLSIVITYVLKVTLAV
ncbi:hypothetical protein WICMUC_003014 [Wickerhamomyces mucosus]|uniref:Auxin efflux carrier n=1 Tax=Wickerhamomyces mucosus TaxID=1378264 RepID=A0A9P8TDX9_9ASCO|nr:hypothetical protein WICMUC_003014 [Wickerhamomyces mucosus]